MGAVASCLSEEVIEDSIGGLLGEDGSDNEDRRRRDHRSRRPYPAQQPIASKAQAGHRHPALSQFRRPDISSERLPSRKELYGINILPEHLSYKMRDYNDNADLEPTPGSNFNEEHEEIDDIAILSSENFVDGEFPPQTRSLAVKREHSFGELLEYIEWKRPCELSGSARMIVDGMRYDDVKQGWLGDCWFVASIATVAANERLLRRVCPSFAQPLSGPAYSAQPLAFRFFHNGQWRVVIIDDYLPCVPSGGGGGRGYEPAFMRSTHPDEMWVSLIEKAYAKLKGCYDNLDGGNATIALTELTGGIAEQMDICDEQPDVLWSRMQNSLKGDSSFVSCSRRGEEVSGVIGGHAYSVLSAACFYFKGQQIQLLKVRNPHSTGGSEFSGDWSDKDSRWHVIPPEAKAAIGYSDREDGQFFIGFQDFCSIFSSVVICTLSPDFQQDGITDRNCFSSLKGRWTKGRTAGGCLNYRDETFHLNPQFVISPDYASDACVSLLQCTEPFSPSKSETKHIGFYVYEVEHEPTRKLDTTHFQYNPLYHKVDAFSNRIQAVSRFHTFPGSHYIVIPSTFDPGVEAEFVLRVYLETSFQMKELT